jgi:oxaloacetate decarboxylase (Na+ extruding) subunit alpha
MAPIEFVDQTLRDGHQSLWGMRMRPEMTVAAAPLIDRTGYRVIDCTGGTQFAVQLRHVHQDPWAGLDMVTGNFHRTPMRAGKRWNAVGVFGQSPEVIVNLFNTTLLKHGISSVWLYDCLYNMEPWRRACQAIYDAGGEVIPAIMYGIGPHLTDEFFATKVREIVDWGIASAIYFEDAPGILTPERAETLIPALVEAAGELPVEMHGHCTTGLQPLNYIKAVEAGVHILHTASRPLANGPSLPSIEATALSLQALGYEVAIDQEPLEKIADHFERIAKQEGFQLGVPVEYDARVYQHQLPGGMTGTLKAQLAEHNLTDRLPDVLDEIVQVREELGHPISATPFSQLIGIQAVVNVTTKERWSVIPDEVIMYALGHLGPPLQPIQPDILDRILAAPRAAVLGAEPPEQMSMKEARERWGGKGVSDEEMLSRYLAPAEDLQKTREAGPPPRNYRFVESPMEMTIDTVLKAGGANLIRYEYEGLSMTLRRRPVKSAA